MSISAYVGLPGHGKSYGVVENVILPALREKRTVFTNIPMDDNKCLDDFGMTVTPFDVVDITKNPNWWVDVFQSGAVFVLDEVWRLWPAGLKANNVREEDKAFLAEHRHMVGENGLSTEIYLVTQDLGQIAAFARALVETTYRVVKMNHIGLDKRFRVDVHTGAVAGPKPPQSTLLRQIPGKFSKDIYQYYQSHTKSKTGAAGDETRTDKRANALGGFSIKAGFAFVVLCVWLASWGIGKYQEKFSFEEQQAAEPVVSASPGELSETAPVQPSRPRLPTFLRGSKAFFVSMTLGQRGSREYFYTAEFDDHQVFLSGADLEALGYQLLAVNDCLIRVTGHDFSGYVMCRRPKQEVSFMQQYLPGQTEGSL